MVKRSVAFSLATLAALWAASGSCSAVDIKRGQTLHDEECVACHDSSVYTRNHRRILNLEELTARVNLCQEDVGAEWNAAQIDDVVNYLNGSFYRF